MKCEGSKKYCLPGHSPQMSRDKRRRPVPHQPKMAEVVRAHIIFERSGAKPILQSYCTTVRSQQVRKQDRILQEKDGWFWLRKGPLFALASSEDVGNRESPARYSQPQTLQPPHLSQPLKSYRGYYSHTTTSQDPWSLDWRYQPM